MEDIATATIVATSKAHMAVLRINKEVTSGVIKEGLVKAIVVAIAAATTAALNTDMVAFTECMVVATAVVTLTEVTMAGIKEMVLSTTEDLATAILAAIVVDTTAALGKDIEATVVVTT